MKPAPAASDVVLSDGGLSVRIDRLGGALLEATYEGQPFLVGAGGPTGAMASFPLVPFGNRVEGNTFSFEGGDFSLQPNSADPLYLHGDGWLGLWEIEEADHRHVRLSFSHVADDASPYHYSATQRISLSAGAIVLELSVQNRGETTLPFGIGQHPFFIRTPQTQLSIRSRTYFGERMGYLPGEVEPRPADLDFEAGAPLPRRWVNNAFDGWDGRVTILWPELRLKASVEADAVFSRYMLYMPADRADFFCLEPMSHLPNGHHMPELGGLTPLAPGESLSGRVKIELASLADAVEE
ncbi:aldose 1-epimerase [Rhizobium sp. BK251]|uniref:aldose 1-epimerase n=1 Tax=Rhizobium sp. BK251 TaxID=2512125 RepID=UPI0010464517|nr:aldose 1-epimerase [Rhizobium sp. BK251]TCL69538.1 aldose 1-epimerase [Rhizobium sp. BK251]